MTADEAADFALDNKKSVPAGSRKKGSHKRVIPMTKILICSSDGDVAARWGQSVDGLGRLSAASSRDAIFSTLEQGHSDIVLLDLMLFNEHYRQIPDLLSNKYPQAAFIFFAQKPSEDEGLFLISQGGRGYCNRYISAELLIKAVEVVRMGEVWLGHKLLFKLMENIARLNNASHAVADSQQPKNARLAQLTERESEIAGLIGDGASNKVIAQKLDITERTVKAHLSSIFRKTGASDRLQLGLLINIRQH